MDVQWVYSVASAYGCQFLGAMIKFPVADIWRATTEQKCKFFSCLVMHNRVLTADNLIKKNWPCDHLCSLCLCMNETTPQSSLTQCKYTEVMWSLTAKNFNLPSYAILVSKGGQLNESSICSVVAHLRRKEES
jgi:hypothetical protein